MGEDNTARCYYYCDLTQPAGRGWMTGDSDIILAMYNAWGKERERETPIIRSSIKNCNGCNGHGMHNRELTLKGIERAVTAGMSDLFPFVLYYPTTPTDFCVDWQNQGTGTLCNLASDLAWCVHSCKLSTRVMA